MAVGVNARTAFSLLFPPILGEFGWDRGVTAGIFSFGFLVSALVTPFVGRLMDRRGPVLVVEIGVAAMAAGLLLAPLSRTPWQLYLTLGRDWEARRPSTISTSTPNAPASGPPTIRSTDAASPMKIANFNGVGGGTIVFTAHYPRMHPSDFRVKIASTASPIDWPIDYWASWNRRISPRTTG